MTRIGRSLPAILLTFALCGAGCGRNQNAPLSEGSENPASPAAQNSGSRAPREASPRQQTEQQLEPLNKDDVELYLRVMRAAAARVTHPDAVDASSDSAVLRAARQILDAGAAGHVPSPDDVKTLARANLVAVAMDQIVAGEMNVDGRRYRGIAEAVESVMQKPALAAALSKSNSVVPRQPATQLRTKLPPKLRTDLRPEVQTELRSEVQTELKKMLDDANATNEQVLAPYRAEITRLLKIVRDPQRLPQ